MEKANMHSLDMVNENIKKIGSIFPECVTETVDENGNVKAAIDFEKLQGGFLSLTQSVSLFNLHTNIL